MPSIVDQLPPEIARQIHPNRRKNEERYWAMRDQLLAQYDGQWIGFAEGRVIASGKVPVEVFHEAENSGKHPFFICVGKEDYPCRIRRTVFPYDAKYPGEALPQMTVEFRQTQGATGTVLDYVIPDTGADASVLPWADCQRLQLDPKQGVQGLLSGVAGAAAATLAFRIWTFIDGQEIPCRLQADFAGNERVIGRDVLNRLEVLFRGPAGEVVISP